MTYGYLFCKDQDVLFAITTTKKTMAMKIWQRVALSLANRTHFMTRIRFAKIRLLNVVLQGLRSQTPDYRDPPVQDQSQASLLKHRFIF